MFDLRLRSLRRDRACRQGAALFLHDRAFDDAIERLTIVRRKFESALLIGCPDPRWKSRLEQIAGTVDAVDPGECFAMRTGGKQVVEDQMNLQVGAYDLCVAIGTLDTVNDLPQALLRIRLALGPNTFFIGAMAGGDTLPRLRMAMRAADEDLGSASPHVHPRIDPSALAGLLSSAGFVDPVVDVDRVRVSYSAFQDLVRDLRAMGATNVLLDRSSRPLSRKAAAAAAAAFTADQLGEKVVERFDILHFAGWTPSDPQG